MHFTEHQLLLEETEERKQLNERLQISDRNSWVLVRTWGHEIYSIWLSVKEQVSGAWPIWYMEVMPDFKTTQRGLANLSSPLSTQHTMMTLRLKTFHLPIILESYIKYSENNLSAWQTHWKVKGWTKWGTYLKSRSHTCINHKESFHCKLEIAAYGLASVAKPLVQYVRIIQVKVSKMDRGNSKK
jgi:hypothetical protein